MKSAGIVGTGLIGASVGLAMREAGWATFGWDTNQETLQKSADLGALSPSRSLEAITEKVDILFLAGPLSANLNTLRSLETGALVTDVTSVKRPFVGAAGLETRFVGGHPMAGREHAGPSAASATLFRGATWVLCSDGATGEDLDYLTRLVREFGANPIQMTAAAHDRAVAEISHLPHLLAVALTNLVAADPASAGLVAGSFRDLTRVAGADTGWWPEVLAANSDEVARALEDLVSRTQSISNAADGGDIAAVGSEFDIARHHRLAMSPSLEGVLVVLQDRPGELVMVGHALERSGVDVRDIQLRHAEHGGGGILTITVRPEEAVSLRDALKEEGLHTV